MNLFSGKAPIPNDILLGQIAEDDDGNMHVLPEEYLISPNNTDQSPYWENDLAVENMENDFPCADLMTEAEDENWPGM
ncbi:hypothetical protein LJB76_01425 [Clostridia bacterium OttesenSCG-928-O13]|nr:hypothetical protein [Clostridia bacterium OttesenSCG-928-O13]